MQSRPMIHLGAGLRVSVPLSLGTLQWGTTPIDERYINSKGCIKESTAQEITNEFCDAKVTLFDTAEGYGGGTSEKRLGRTVTRAFGNSSVEFSLLMTKFLPTFWRHSHACFENALRASLLRLGVDCCPIYLIHTPIHWRPIEYWIQAAAICKKKGLLTAVGLSNCNAEQVRRAVRAGETYGVPVVVNQVLFSLFDYQSDALQKMAATCRDLDVTIIAYSPLGQGLFTDGLSEATLSSNRTAKMLGIQWGALQPLRASIRRIADAHGGRTMAQVSLNWCISHGTIPLVGCRSLNQARDSLACLEWTLTSEEVLELDNLALGRSTLESPPWRRHLFVTLAGWVMLICRFYDWLGFGGVKQAR
eukprot:m.156408 g.156408  ORF g.156408 m.156408 type:complete len:361 (+) comp30992_c0_seq2:280-1362(+)